jgi:hypothetical protein
MEPHLYFHGYDYSTGVLAAGAPCVAPLLELTNKLPEELHVSWLNRTLIGDDVLGADPAVLGSYFCNRVVVGVGELTIITNFYASAGFYRSILRLETASSGVDYFVMNFSAEAGYYLLRLPQVCGPPSPSEACLCDPYSKSLVEFTPFAPSFCGSRVPRWRDCVIFPVVVRRASPHELPSGVPCLLQAEAV